MPIRFYCHRCQQLLSIGTRKAGTQIACPNCGAPQLVPEEPAGGGASGPSAVEADGPITMVALPGAGRDAARQSPAPIAIPDDIQLDPLPRGFDRPPVIAAASAPPARRRGRHTVVWLLLLVIVGGGSLAGGYFAGRRNTPLDAAASNAAGAPPTVRVREPLLLEGKVLVESTPGKLSSDAKSLVLAVPATPTTQPVALAGLSLDGDPAAGLAVQQPLSKIGGAVDAADATGSFGLVLGGPGAYRFLVVSKTATRPAGSPIDGMDLADMRRYFAGAEKLIGDRQYCWEMRMVSKGQHSLQVSFSSDMRFAPRIQ